MMGMLVHSTSFSFGIDHQLAVQCGTIQMHGGSWLSSLGYRTLHIPE
jgi:hypothetical protein